MAIDTRQKRFSMVNAFNPVPLALFESDGAVDADDRAHLLNLYSGISLADLPEAVTFSGPVGNQQIVVSTPFSLDLAPYFSGNLTPFTYSLVNGTLPDGLSLNTSTGEISGTPTTVEVQSNIAVRATDTDTNTADTNYFQITVEAGTVAISFSGPIADRTAFQHKGFSLNTESYFNGTETPFSYALQAGTLPPGLSLDTNTGIISGTATTLGTYAGIVIRGTDQNLDTADTNAFTITVSEAPASNHITDLKFDALRAQGHTGAVSEMMLAWLQADGATSNKLNDAWREMLTSKGFTTGNNNDDWYALLGSLGFTEKGRNSRERDFWAAGGLLT